MSDPIRLAKRVAVIARCSCAEAGQYIEGGWVRVDGDVVEDPQFQVTTQVVEIDPHARLTPPEPATILLHKPVDVAFSASTSLVTPDTRARVDPSGWRIHARHFAELTTLMTLDAHASGLVVLSQDGRVCRRLTDDAAELEQEFMVEVSGDIGPHTLSRLARGLRHRGRALPACKVSWQNEAQLRFAIKDVRPGQLRHMCSEVGLAALTIKRTRIGRISLGKTPPGQWRYMPVTDRF
ncbi:MAG: rRNA pseudouridine synthase [Pseudoxanthomonas sp.]